jgi:hypothetical protein
LWIVGEEQLRWQAVKLIDTTRVIKMFMECDFNCVKCALFIQGQIYVGFWEVDLLTYIFGNYNVDGFMYTVR